MAKFEKGNPGGPGRPRGSRNAVNLLLDQLAVGSAEALVQKMIDAAAGGDRVAARLVLNRIWSAPKGRAVSVELPEIKTPADLLAAHAAVAAAISNAWSNGQTEGQITRLKLIKRQMYGRAKLDLLEARLIGAD